MGDTYASSPDGRKDKSVGWDGKPRNNLKESHKAMSVVRRDKIKGIPQKCLCQIPQRFSIEMCNRGWILRNVIIWHSVWSISPKPYPEAHFAVYPTELLYTPIKAGCPKGGLVLDPFMGSGTTAWVARKFGRDYLGIELSPEYIKLAEKRLAQQILL